MKNNDFKKLMDDTTELRTGKDALPKAPKQQELPITPNPVQPKPIDPDYTLALKTAPQNPGYAALLEQVGEIQARHLIAQQEVTAKRNLEAARQVKEKVEAEEQAKLPTYIYFLTGNHETLRGEIGEKTKLDRKVFIAELCQFAKQNGILFDRMNEQLEIYAGYESFVKLLDLRWSFVHCGNRLGAAQFEIKVKK